MRINSSGMDLSELYIRQAPPSFPLLKTAVGIMLQRKMCYAFSNTLNSTCITQYLKGKKVRNASIINHKESNLLSWPFGSARTICPLNACEYII